MAKKAATKPAKRKPRNTIVDAAPQIAELAKRMEAERARIIAEMAAEEHAKKKPVDDSPFELSDFSEDTKKRLAEILDAKPETVSVWRDVLAAMATVIPLMLSGGVGLVFGIYSTGGIDIGPGPHKSDAVSAVFDAQESAFRKYSGELAAALRSGEVKSEKEASVWMDSHFGPESEKAWVTLLTEEAKAFGGEQWTAEKHAAHIERYAR